MGKNGKFDLIATSKKKSYKITMGVITGVGVLLLALGFLLMSGVTRTVMPNKLEINHLSGLNGNGNCYTLTLSINQTFVIDTGTSNKALKAGIEFKLDDNAKLFLEEIPTIHRGESLVELKIKPDARQYDQTVGRLMISCASWQKWIDITYQAPVIIGTN